MSLYNGPPRPGARGGRAEFSWDNVKADKDREYYLGHSVKATTGRWQKGKDVFWYNKEKSDYGVSKEELEAVRQRERDMMAEALGLKPKARPTQLKQPSLEKHEVDKLLKGGGAEEPAASEQQGHSDRTKGLGYNAGVAVALHEEVHDVLQGTGLPATGAGPGSANAAAGGNGIMTAEQLPGEANKMAANRTDKKANKQNKKKKSKKKSQEKRKHKHKSFNSNSSSDSEKMQRPADQQPQPHKQPPHQRVWQQHYQQPYQQPDGRHYQSHADRHEGECHDQPRYDQKCKRDDQNRDGGDRVQRAGHAGKLNRGDSRSAREYRGRSPLHRAAYSKSRSPVHRKRSKSRDHSRSRSPVAKRHHGSSAVRQHGTGGSRSKSPASRYTSSRR